MAAAAPIIQGLAALATAVLGAIGGAKQRKQIEKALQARQEILRRALAIAEQQYAAKAPLRDIGLAALSDLFSGKPGFFSAGGRGIFRIPEVAGDLSGKFPDFPPLTPSSPRPEQEPRPEPEPEPYRPPGERPKKPQYGGPEPEEFNSVNAALSALGAASAPVSLAKRRKPWQRVGE